MARLAVGQGTYKSDKGLAVLTFTQKGIDGIPAGRFYVGTEVTMFKFCGNLEWTSTRLPDYIASVLEVHKKLAYGKKVLVFVGGEEADSQGNRPYILGIAVLSMNLGFSMDPRKATSHKVGISLFQIRETDGTLEQLSMLTGAQAVLLEQEVTEMYMAEGHSLQLDRAAFEKALRENPAAVIGGDSQD